MAKLGRRNPLKCEICGKICTSPMQLGSHKRFVHKIAGNSKNVLNIRKKSVAVATEQGGEGRHEGQASLGQAIAALELEVACTQAVINKLKLMKEGQ